ncbi:nucleotide exchange factor GrpE [Candidatus Poribacteria bacterium]|nr:nucleotide exchange factor GrpE [Candidatus Poribacteria bacterium]
MGRLTLRDWLWRGTFEVEGNPLAVWDGALALDAADCLQARVSAHLAELWRLLDLTEQIEKRGVRDSGTEMQNVARAMLPVLDALDRLNEYGQKMSSDTADFATWIKALEGVSLRLSRALEKVGLSAMVCMGAEVDLGLHDVVATVRTQEYPENTIIEERQKGYYFRGRLLRDAKVVVAVSP